MEFILISDSKLKVMLTKNDLEEFDVRADELDYANTETKRIFWDIIGRAKKSVGFNCDGFRVLVQMYTSRDGGCEMFVSKLGHAHNDELEDQTPPISYKPLYKSQAGQSRTGAFGFDRLEWLISVCRRLHDIGYSGESTVYIGDDKRFYLILDGLDATGYITVDEYSFINEYGTAENHDATSSFLLEHGKRLCHGDAVEIFSSL